MSGNVNKAPLVGANVDLHTINANGTVGAHVAGPFVTDASGNWTGQIPAGAAGPFVMVATGGSYVDEATGSTVSLAVGQEWYGLLQGVSSQVTPLTHATFLAMRTRVDGGATLANAITPAVASSQATFGYNFATTVRTLYVGYFDGTTSYVWNLFNGAGIPGVSRAGGVTSFTNVTLTEFGGAGSLTLNGSLTEPLLP